MKKILIINGHPDKESFNFGLSEAYKKGAEKSNGEITRLIRGTKINKMGRPFGLDLSYMVGVCSSNNERVY